MPKTNTIDTQRRQKPRWLFGMTSGKCFYCGSPTFNHGWPKTRDWLFIRPNAEFVREHKTPSIRGGSDGRENLVPACAKCNSNKGSFTADEFRFLRGLRSGSLSFRFAFDPPAAIDRDWLCCHSEDFERRILVHNLPAANEAYRLRNAWARGPQAKARRN